MITLRKADARGYANHGWLESWHSFSFAGYHAPAHVRFGALRVINEDIVQPGTGFDTHGHRDMEIVTCILSSRLRHRDSMGNGEDNPSTGHPLTQQILTPSHKIQDILRARSIPP